MLEIKRDCFLIRVVDDDVELLDAIKFCLECADWRVAIYVSATSFLANENFEQPGCIILDINMPSISGLELQQFLNTCDHALPVVFLTGHGNMNTAIHAFRHGAVDFL